jgi:hypothetical protein
MAAVEKAEAERYYRSRKQRERQKQSTYQDMASPDSVKPSQRGYVRVC